VHLDVEHDRDHQLPRDVDGERDLVPTVPEAEVLGEQRRHEGHGGDEQEEHEAQDEEPVVDAA
jgi:hypothetical protein